MNPFEFDSEEDPDRRTRLGRIEYNTAEDIFDRVKDSCKPSDEWPRCMVEHSPDKFDEFVNRYLNGEEAEELKRFIENNSDVYKTPDEFWNEVKILYEALWTEWMTTKIAEALLNKFRDAIQHALNEKKPLSKEDLYYWFTDLGAIGLGADQVYYNMVNYWLSYYDKLSDDIGKLDALEVLLNEMDDVFSRINEELSELEALTNQS